MARRRNIKRDGRGRFSRVAGAKVATRAVGRKAARTVKQSYVRGSAYRHLDVGPSGNFKSVTVGAEFKTRSGREALVRASAGYHGKPDRRLDVSPKLKKAKRELVVTVRPNPARKVAAPSAKASAGSKKRTAPNKSTSAGTRLRH